MRLIAPEMKAFTEKSRKAQQMGDYELMKEEREKFSQLRKALGIKPWLNILGLVQIPFLISWFISLRYMSMNPDLFPRMTSGKLK